MKAAKPLARALRRIDWQRLWKRRTGPNRGMITISPVMPQSAGYQRLAWDSRAIVVAAPISGRRPRWAGAGLANADRHDIINR